MTSDDAAETEEFPTELFETIRSFCSVMTPVVWSVVCNGVGDLDDLGVAPVCIIWGIPRIRDVTL